MKNLYHYKTKQGLEVLFVKKQGFVKSYCGIGCKFGGADILYEVNGKEKKAPYGIAHFIEHKLFQMSDGSDAFMTFNEQNAYSNAYTASDKTIYYFTKNEEVWDSLKLLLDMYFTPVFLKKDIETEKSIIQSEINMYDDNIGYLLTQQGLNLLYPKDFFSMPILGDNQSVMKTTPKDLYDVYHTFYVPSNSVLCVVGDYEEDKLFSFIEKQLEGMEVSDSDIERKKTIFSQEVLPPIHYENDRVSQEEAIVFLRMDELTNLDITSCEKILGIIDALFNISSKFYKEIEDLLSNDLDYQVVTHWESSYIMISGPSKKPKVLAEKIIKLLKNIKSEDIETHLLELYLKHLLSKNILTQDGVESLGDTILGFALENIDYSKYLEEVRSLTVEDILKIVPYFHSAKMTYIVASQPKSKRNTK